MSSDFTVHFFGVGAPRCGTTWLYRCLQEHPDVCMPSPKEVHFFSDFMPFTTTHSLMGWEWYESKFNHCQKNQLCGEFSPSYLYDNNAAQRIKDAFPQAKIIIQLRNPIDAIFSYYLHAKCTFTVEDTFEKFLDKNEYFKNIYKYDEQIRRYQELFSKDQLLYLQYEDIEDKPDQVFDSVCQFLGISSITPSCLHKRINSYGSYKHRWLRNLMAKTKDILDSNAYTQYLYKKCRIDHLGLKLVLWNRVHNIQKASLKPKVREHLQQYYAESNMQVQKLSGLKTEHWSV